MIPSGPEFFFKNHQFLHHVMPWAGIGPASAPPHTRPYSSNAHGPRHYPTLTCYSIFSITHTFVLGTPKNLSETLDYCIESLVPPRNTDKPGAPSL
jgi:hypothetical protein